MQMQYRAVVVGASAGGIEVFTAILAQLPAQFSLPIILVQHLRKDQDDWLPELKQLPRNQREAVDAITSFEMWHRLRYHQGLGKKAAIDVLVGLLISLVED